MARPKFSLSLAMALWAWLTGSTAFAQNDLRDLLGGGRKPRTAIPKAEVTVSTEPVAAKPGETIALQVLVRVPEGYYIYGVDGGFGGRTQIKVSGPADLEPLGEGFTPNQPGKTAFDADLDAEVTKHHGEVTWSRRFQLPSNVSADVTISGTLDGQYCSGADAGGRCVPLKHPFSVTVAIDRNVPERIGPVFEQTLRPTRSSKADNSSEPIEFRISLTPTDAKPGDTVTLAVTAALNKGWHTYALTQKDLGGEPTTIDVERLMNLEPLTEAFVAEPAPIQEAGPNNEQLLVHHHAVTWTRPYRVTGEKTGDYGVAGEISYQVCDSIRCLPVNVVAFELGRDSENDTPADSDHVPGPFVMVEPEPDPDPVAETLTAAPVAVVGKPQDKGLWAFLVLCVGGGFLALLTPCSFPMVPITVSFFLKQAEQEHRAPWKLALVYCGSIVLTFTVLGVGIAFLFGATKLNELANNPWLNAAIGIVFVVFAFNMLGAFEIHVPSWLLTWSATHESTGGYLGAVFMAITFTLTSFTCTFAVAGSLLLQAAQGNVYWPILGMLLFGTAFASPFFVLALLPGMLKKLPKSGGWMNAVKVVLGLVEIGAAVKFLSLADMVWNPVPVLFDYVTVMLIWAVLSLAIAMYLFGLYRFPHDSAGNAVSAVRACLAMSFLGLAGMLGLLLLQPERANGWIMDSIIAFAPPQFDKAPPVAVAANPAALVDDIGPTTEHHGIRFALDFDRAVPLAVKQGRPLLLDFTGVNCVNCRRMEKKMAEPENRRRIEQFVAVQLYTDKVPVIADNAHAERLALLNRKRQVQLVGDVSLPGYAIVTPDGRTVLATFVGFAPGEEFTEFLDLGWQKWQAVQVAQRPAVGR